MAGGADAADGLRAEIAALRAEVAALRGRLDGVPHPRDLVEAAWRAAAADAAAHWQAHLQGVPTFPDRHALMDHAQAQVTLDGLWLEFGVADGGTLRRMALRRPAVHFHGFDSFEGLPEAWVNHPVGGFTRGGALPDMPANVTLHRGWFADTVPGFFAAREAQAIAFMHIDCDLYSATATVLAAAWPHLRAGTVIQFDEYWNYPGWREHEFRAWAEHAAAHDIAWTHLGFDPKGTQMAIRIERNAGPQTGTTHPGRS